MSAAEATALSTTALQNAAPEAAAGPPAGRLARARSGAADLLNRPLLAAGALSTVLALAYLLTSPPAGDLAAATYRSALFSRAGFTLWDTGWYGGQNLLGYSVLSGPLGALVGVRLLLALSALASCLLFAAIARPRLGGRAGTVAALWFALVSGVGLLDGRVPFGLGLAIALGALLALQRRRFALALALAFLCSLASPLAGAFLALTGVALAIGRERRRPLAMAVLAALPVGLLAAVFPDGGYEPFVLWDLLPALVASCAIGLAPARPWPALRAGAALYALFLVACYAVHTPVGANAARLAELLAGPLLAGLLWERHRRLLALLAPALLYWALLSPVETVLTLAGERSAGAAYYAPLVRELGRLSAGAPTRVEVPMTEAHAEAAYLPAAGGLPGSGGLLLARGWDRQLDTRFAGLFYGGPLRPEAYRRWLQENGVSYVALPDAPLDRAGRRERALIGSGPPFLRELWRSAHWRLFAVAGAPSLASPPARILTVGTDSFALWAPHPGRFVVRLRFSPYWALLSGHGCVSEAAHGWTALEAARGGDLRVGIAFSAGRIFAHSARCR